MKATPDDHLMAVIRLPNDESVRLMEEFFEDSRKVVDANDNVLLIYTSSLYVEVADKEARVTIGMLRVNNGYWLFDSSDRRFESIQTTTKHNDFDWQALQIAEMQIAKALLPRVLELYPVPPI
jgi:hypothetical protein